MAIDNELEAFLLYEMQTATIQGALQRGKVKKYSFKYYCRQNFISHD